MQGPLYFSRFCGSERVKTREGIYLGTLAQKAVNRVLPVALATTSEGEGKRLAGLCWRKRTASAMGRGVKKTDRKGRKRLLKLRGKQRRLTARGRAGRGCRKGNLGERERLHLQKLRGQARRALKKQEGGQYSHLTGGLLGGNGGCFSKTTSSKAEEKVLWGSRRTSRTRSMGNSVWT